MNAKHTPGPWRIVENAKFGDRAGQAICGVEKAFDTISIHAMPDDKPCPPVESWNEEAEANAKLIAAAPEMLALLQEFAGDENGFDGNAWFKRVESVIKKATI